VLLGYSGPTFQWVTSYNYPAFAPALSEYWWSFVPVGNPDTSPGTWNFDSITSGWFDNGTQWEDDFVPASAPTSTYIVTRYNTGSQNSEWSNYAIVP
jgi:hypothetical protein